MGAYDYSQILDTENTLLIEKLNELEAKVEALQQLVPDRPIKTCIPNDTEIDMTKATTLSSTNYTYFKNTAILIPEEPCHCIGTIHGFREDATTTVDTTPIDMYGIQTPSRLKLHGTVQCYKGSGMTQIDNIAPTSGTLKQVVSQYLKDPITSFNVIGTFSIIFEHNARAIIGYLTLGDGPAATSMSAIKFTVLNDSTGLYTRAQNNAVASFVLLFNKLKDSSTETGPYYITLDIDVIDERFGNET